MVSECRELEKAGKLGVDGMNKTGRAIHGTAEFGFRAARGAIKNSKDLAILAGTGWAAYNIYNGNGIVNQSWELLVVLVPNKEVLLI